MFKKIISISTSMSEDKDNSHLECQGCIFNYGGQKEHMDHGGCLHETEGCNICDFFNNGDVILKFKDSGKINNNGFKKED